MIHCFIVVDLLYYISNINKTHTGGNSEEYGVEDGVEAGKGEWKGKVTTLGAIVFSGTCGRQ